MAVVPARVHDTVRLRAISGLVDLHDRKCINSARSATVFQGGPPSAGRRRPSPNTRPHRAPERERRSAMICAVRCSSNESSGWRMEITSNPDQLVIDVAYHFSNGGCHSVPLNE